MQLSIFSATGWLHQIQNQPKNLVPYITFECSNMLHLTDSLDDKIVHVSLFLDDAVSLELRLNAYGASGTSSRLAKCNMLLHSQESTLHSVHITMPAILMRGPGTEQQGHPCPRCLTMSGRSEFGEGACENPGVWSRPPCHRVYFSPGQLHFNVLNPTANLSFSKASPSISELFGRTNFWQNKAILRRINPVRFA